MRHVIFFFRLFVWFSLRNMRKHSGRALTVLLGIALGTAVFTSIRLSVSASLESFTKSMDMIAGKADKVLTQPGGYVPEDLIAQLLQQAEIQHASPLLTTYTKIASRDMAPFLLIGFDPILDRPFRNWTVQKTSGDDQDAAAWMELLKTPYTVIMGKTLTDEIKGALGESFIFEHTFQNAKFKIVGIMNREGLSLVEGGRIAIADIATFQEFTGLIGKVDRIDLRFSPEFSSKDMTALREILPESIVLNSPDASKESGRMMIRSYQLNLSVLSFASLFVGMFLVYSLVAFNAAARRHELAVLLSTGASRAHVFFIFLVEGAFFGVVGWLLAIPISGSLIKYLIGGVSQTIATLFVRVQAERLSLDLWELLLSFGVTLFVSVLAAYQPAKEAMNVSPKEALEISQIGTRLHMSATHSATLGLLCILLVFPLSRLPAVLNMPLAGYFSIMLLFAGFSLNVPWALKKAGQVFSPILLKRFGISAYLAGRYVRDSGKRTAVSVGALLTAVALFVSLVIMIYSFRQTVESWTYQTIQGDLFITAKMGDVNQFRYPIPDQIIQGLKTYGSLIDIVPNRRFSLMYQNLPYEFDLTDMVGFMRYGSFLWLEGNPKIIQQKLVDGEGVVVSEVFSNRTGLSIGDIFEAQVEGSKVSLPILGIVRDYRTRGGAVFFSLIHFGKQYHPVQWSGMRIFFKEKRDALDIAASELRNDMIQRFGDQIDIIVGSRLRGAILRIFDETFAVTSVLLLIALMIAALGIATTLAVLVLERSRQLNTLFAIGADFNQIRAIIFWEAAFLVVLGELFGAMCGFALSHILIFVINRQSFGWTFLYGIDWGAFMLSGPLIALVALAAALPAVKLVFREPPATLLREW
jgi:putative ABC transport system permease protein